MSSSVLIERIQGLRFIAAALVLLGHIIMEVLQHSQALASVQFNPVTSQAIAYLRTIPWAGGVDIFFVISGFIISYGSLSRPASARSSIEFLTRRIIRIWPTYFIFTCLMVVATILFHNELAHPNLHLDYILASLVFIAWERPDDGRIFPLLGQGWTLNYEMFFYTCFALAILLPRKGRVPALVSGGIFLILIGSTFSVRGTLAFYSDPIIAEFLFGVFLGVAFRYLPSSAVGGGAMLAIGTALLYILHNYTPELPRIFKAGVPAALIVGGVLLSGHQGERLLGKPLLVLLGNASYALYLSHPFVVNALILLWLKLKVGSPWLFMSIAVVGSTCASCIIYLVMERPILNFLGRAFSRLSTRRTVAIAS